MVREHAVNRQTGKPIKKWRRANEFAATGKALPADPDKLPVEQLAEYLHSRSGEVSSFPEENQYRIPAAEYSPARIGVSYDVDPSGFPAEIANIEIILQPEYQSPPKGAMDSFFRWLKIRSFRRRHASR